MRSFFFFLGWLWWLSLVCCLSGPAHGAQLDTVTTPLTQVSADMLKQRLGEVQKATTLEEKVKKQLVDLYQQSLDNLEAASGYGQMADQFSQTIVAGPAQLQKIRADRDAAAGQDKEADDQNSRPGALSLKEAESALLQAKAKAASLEAQTATLEHQLATLNDRPAKASQRLAELKKTEQALANETLQAPPPGQMPQLVEALIWQRQTRVQALQNERKMLQQELLSMPVAVALASAQGEKAGALLVRVQTRVRALENLVNQQRQEEAVRSVNAAEQAQRQVADGSPVLQEAAAVNAALGEELQRSTADLEQVSAEKERLSKNLKNLEDQSKNTRQKYQLAGWNQVVGLMLSEQRRALPDLSQLRKRMTDNEASINATSLLQIQHGEEQQRLDNIEGYTTQLLAEAPMPQSDAELRTLLLNRRELLDKVVVLNQTVLGVRTQMDAVYRQMIDQVDSFRDFLSERLLWVRNMPPLGLADFKTLPHETSAFFSLPQWMATGTLLLSQFTTSALPLAVCSLVLLLRLRRRYLLRQLESVVNRAINPAKYTFFQPLLALLLTLLRALPWPLLLLGLGWSLQNAPETTKFARAVGTGMISFAHPLYLLLWLCELLLPQSLAQHFFHWPKAAITKLSRGVNALIYGFLPAIFFTQVAFQVNAHADGRFVLERLIFIVAIGLLGLAFYRIFHPRTGVWHGLLHQHAQHFVTRIYPALFFLIMLLPVLFSGVVVAGFVVAVGSLIRCLFNSLWVIVGLVVGHQFLIQWLVQSERQIRLKQQQRQEPSPQPGKSSQELTGGAVEEGSEADLVELGADSQKLLNALVILAGAFGMWWVWADVLPALRIFDNLVLWTYPVNLGGQETLMQVTLSDVGLSLLIGFLTFVGSQHLPALLNIVLLQHLDISAGSRYTTTTLIRYAIGATGFLLLTTTLGFRWAQIQWLIAALGVGIGFGLQEIVANFISGLILLFERPIRVGDVVTVGGTDGTVTRIRIRATTIRDFDRKELLVPNKEFITGQLLNWSLTDAMIRLTIPVGVAYGSDLEQAMRLMGAVARNHPMVLAEPPVVVTFDSFGDSTLLLTLRCFIGSIEQRVRTKSELNLGIDRQFRAAGINIAFPQHDVHLDTPAPIAVQLVGRGRGVERPSTPASEGET